MKANKEELQRVVREAQDKIWKIERREKAEYYGKMIGRCFRFRNSCGGGNPQWWLYAKVIGVNDGHPILFRFEEDCHKRIVIEPHENRYGGLSGEYQPIKASEFSRAWKALQKKIAGFKP